MKGEVVTTRRTITLYQQLNDTKRPTRVRFYATDIHGAVIAISGWRNSTAEAWQSFGEQIGKEL